MMANHCEKCGRECQCPVRNPMSQQDFDIVSMVVEALETDKGTPLEGYWAWRLEPLRTKYGEDVVLANMKAAWMQKREVR